MSHGKKLALMWLASLLGVVFVLPWFFYGLWCLGGTVGMLVGGFAGYVLLNYLGDPYRPPWEASLFGTRGAAAIRRRRWLNPHYRDGAGS